MPLKDRVHEIPFTPGVYFMKNGDGQILYIGKARSLRKRVRSYFLNKTQHPKIPILMSQVAEIDYIETATEVDALLLEAQLVRQYQPRYNKELKDDKSFPLLKITSDRYPRIILSRNRKDKKAIYYGPYTDAKLLREAITLINTLFPIRKCRRLPKTACLYYHIGQCLAPCIKPEIKQEYDALIKEVRGFLGGGKRSFVDYLNDRMQEAAKELRFEDAQYYKEQIEALGKLKKKRFSLQKGDEGVLLSATLELKKILRMEKAPEKIVCFDVSNIQGDEAVASKVSFYRELSDKLEYRRYKIKTVSGIHDYAMIQEALGRMLVGLKEGRENFIPDVIMIDGGKGHLRAAHEVLTREGFENIKLISLAKKFEIVYEAAFAPEGGRDSFKAVDLNIPRDSSALYLLQKVRDEAHRFAITYHRSLKQKGIRKSVLDGIPGIGPRRKTMLLKQFDSIEELKRAGIEQLAGLPGMTTALAHAVWTYMHP
ncbi:MAG: excinuclease ABC subunit UvrC [Candidatus Omnitrophica bacterium]|nr:excinuclease ABC subunit UvrC [Candidatus Omnitrophota bacterium]